MKKPNTRPQVLLRIPASFQGHEAQEIVKKWPDGSFSIEMQVGDGVINHNSTTPIAFFPLTQEQVNEIIAKYKEPENK